MLVLTIFLIITLNVRVSSTIKQKYVKGLNSSKQAALNDSYIFLVAREATGVLLRHNLRHIYLNLLIKHHATSSFPS